MCGNTILFSTNLNNYKRISTKEKYKKVRNQDFKVDYMLAQYKPQ